MTAQHPDVVAGTAHLRQALDHIAAALEAADLDALLRAEGTLGDALRRLSSLPASLPSADRDAVRREVRAARHTLERCRRLGAALLDAVRLSLEAQGRAPDYGRQTDGAAVFASRTVTTG